MPPQLVRAMAAAASLSPAGQVMLRVLDAEADETIGDGEEGEVMYEPAIPMGKGHSMSLAEFQHSLNEGGGIHG